MKLLRFTAAVLALVPVSSVLAITTNTVSFQKGDVNGYNGISELRISMTPASDGTDGSTVTNFGIDGYQPDNPATTTTNEFSPDQPSLTKFNDIIGSGPTKIPQGATILDAQLRLKTTNGGSADSNGPWSVASLNQPFDMATTRYMSFPSSDPLGYRGPWWQDGYTARPIAAFTALTQNLVVNANIGPIVQQWANDPTKNNGFVIQSGFTGTADAWAYFTSGQPVQADKPKLTVTYTTDPIATNTIQRGLNGYTGITTAWVKSGTVQTALPTKPDPSVDDVTYDGFSGTATVSPTSTITPAPTTLTSFQQFVDGPAYNVDGTLNSTDDFALLKFNNVFGSGVGQAPADKSVAKAWLVITSGNSSANTRSTDKWDAYAMQRDWDATSLYSTGFGATPGLQSADGDIGATPLSEQVGMTTGSEVYFDVTSYLEAIRNGAADHGLAILHGADATDGWQMWFDGASDPTVGPRLVVLSDLSAVTPQGVAGDYNNDGAVDAQDYAIWRKNVGTSNVLPNDPIGGQIGDGQYTQWRSHYGAVPGGAGTSLGGTSVPEPGTCLLGLVACAAFAQIQPRRTMRARS